MMKSILTLAVIAMVSLIGTGCRQHDYRTLEIDVPGMKNAQCEQLIRRALARNGIVQEKVEVDLAGRRVTVVYDSLFMANKNIEFFIAKLGFAANGIPADTAAAAKLPAACR